MSDKYELLRESLHELQREASARGGNNPRSQMILDLLADHEARQAECEKLRAALKRLCNIYVVDDYYSGEERERRLDEAVRRSIDAVGGLGHE